MHMEHIKINGTFSNNSYKADYPLSIPHQWLKKCIARTSQIPEINEQNKLNNLKSKRTKYIFNQEGRRAIQIIPRRLILN